MDGVVRKSGFFGYGIVDKDGKPYPAKFNISILRKQIEGEVQDLNEDRRPGHPFRVVKLYWEEDHDA